MAFSKGLSSPAFVVLLAFFCLVIPEESFGELDLLVWMVVADFGFLELHSPKHAYSHTFHRNRSPWHFKTSLALFGQTLPGCPAHAAMLYCVMRELLPMLFFKRPNFSKSAIVGVQFQAEMNPRT